jgi:hypothetical protein
LTEEGQRKYKQISQIQAGWVNRLSRGLEVEKLKNAVALLRDVQTRLREETDDVTEP